MYCLNPPGGSVRSGRTRGAGAAGLPENDLDPQDDVSRPLGTRVEEGDVRAVGGVLSQAAEVGHAAEAPGDRRVGEARASTGYRGRRPGGDRCRVGARKPREVRAQDPAAVARRGDRQADRDQVGDGVGERVLAARRERVRRRASPSAERRGVGVTDRRGRRPPVRQRELGRVEGAGQTRRRDDDRHRQRRRFSGAGCGRGEAQGQRENSEQPAGTPETGGHRILLTGREP